MNHLIPHTPAVVIRKRDEPGAVLVELDASHSPPIGSLHSVGPLVILSRHSHAHD